MKNQYLLFTVFYENQGQNQYLSAGKDNSTSQVESIVANIYKEILSLPLNTQKSYPSHAFAGDRKNLLHDDVVFALDKPSNDLFSTFRKNLMIRLIFLM